MSNKRFEHLSETLISRDSEKNIPEEKVSQTFIEILLYDGRRCLINIHEIACIHEVKNDSNTKTKVKLKNNDTYDLSTSYIQICDFISKAYDGKPVSESDIKTAASKMLQDLIKQ
jgi:hypothetical protein